MFPCGIISLLSEELSLGIRGSQLPVSNLSFPSSENVCILPSFLKDLFAGYRILCWQFFPEEGLKYIGPLLSLSSMVSSKESMAIGVFVLRGNMSFFFSLPAFKIVLCLVFSTFFFGFMLWEVRSAF